MAENFDTEGFYAALNATRLSEQKTWKDVAEEAGVAASTLSRMKQGAKPDVDGLAALLKWSSLKAETFIFGSSAKEPASLATLTSLLRADPHLTPEKAKLMEEILVSTYDKLRST